MLKLRMYLDMQGKRFNVIQKLAADNQPLQSPLPV